MNTAYILIVILINNTTSLPIGAQTFELASAKDCIEMKDYAQNQFRQNLPKEITGNAACFRNLGAAKNEL